MALNFIINSKELNLSDIFSIIEEGKNLVISAEAMGKIEVCRFYLDELMHKNKKPIYGINTGFGALHNVKISKNNLTKLQENLVMSHACGMGKQVPNIIVKLMLLLKIQSLSYGHSGVQLETVLRLIDFYNNDILPVVFERGSLGASGDLAPLAHLALPLIGKGEVVYKGKIVSSEIVLNEFGWKPITLQSKEGLALLNGTQFMSSYGIYILMRSFKLSYFADLLGSMSLEAFDGRVEPFSELVHQIRPHRGQIMVAKRISNFLKASQLIKQKKQHVQDPYSFRCMPQVHGATWDTLKFAENTFLTEINSVTDNPNVFVEENKVISGGNFHGQPLALALDYLKIALSELGNISERRTFHLVSGERGLPPFLVSDPGLNSGFMIPQYTAASIVSANKQLATPASIDSIVSSNGQEDHVSMGANAAVQAFEMLENVWQIFAIELNCASQALFFRQLKSSKIIEAILQEFRTEVPVVEKDCVLHNHMVKSLNFIKNYHLESDQFLD